MFKQILFVFVSVFITGCVSTHYDSLDEKSDGRVLISSNVPAEIWLDNQKIKDTAKEHTLEQVGMQTVTLKAAGMKDSKILVFKTLSEKKNVTSHESSVSWSVEKTSDISSDLSETGGEAMTTSPTSTVLLPINLVKVVGKIAFLPFSFMTEFNPMGYYIAYDKNQFYVEMVSENASEQTVLNAFQLNVKSFVLKNYPELVKGNQEYIVALSGYSGVKVEDISQALTLPLPAQAAEAIASKVQLVAE